MSVLACNRRGCENVMCDRLSREHGYICDECFDELLTINGSMTIDEFMESEKNATPIPKDDWKWNVEREFTLQHRLDECI